MNPAEVSAPRRRILAGCLAACGTLGALAAPTPVFGTPSGDDEALELLDRAREAAGSGAFEGTVVVGWRDGTRRHSEEVPVRCVGGILRFGDDVVGAGARRMVHGQGHDTDGWLSLWATDVATVGPPPSAKYRLSVAPGPSVAARPTDVVSVSLIGGDRPRERLYVDRVSGLLLRRELLDGAGQPYRSVAFSSLRPASSGTLAAAASAPVVSRSREPVPVHHLRAPYRLKTRIGAGYQLVGAYKAGGVVQQFFSDGLHGLSVFEQPGHLRRSRSGSSGDDGGRSVEIAGARFRAWSAPVGETLVWESESLVYTAVTDASWADLAEAVKDLPHAERPGRLRRVAQTVVSFFRWR